MLPLFVGVSRLLKVVAEDRHLALVVQVVREKSLLWVKLLFAKMGCLGRQVLMNSPHYSVLIFVFPLLSEIQLREENLPSLNNYKKDN